MSFLTTTTTKLSANTAAFQPGGSVRQTGSLLPPHGGGLLPPHGGGLLPETDRKIIPTTFYRSPTIWSTGMRVVVTDLKFGETVYGKVLSMHDQNPEQDYGTTKIRVPTMLLIQFDPNTKLENAWIKNLPHLIRPDHPNGRVREPLSSESFLNALSAMDISVGTNVDFRDRYGVWRQAKIVSDGNCRGYSVTLSYHLPNPLTGKSATSPTSAITTTTETILSFYEEPDRVAPFNSKSLYSRDMLVNHPYKVGDNVEVWFYYPDVELWQHRRWRYGSVKAIDRNSVMVALHEKYNRDLPTEICQEWVSFKTNGNDIHQCLDLPCGAAGQNKDHPIYANSEIVEKRNVRDYSPPQTVINVLDTTTTTTPKEFDLLLPISSLSIGTNNHLDRSICQPNITYPPTGFNPLLSSLTPTLA